VKNEANFDPRAGREIGVPGGLRPPEGLID